MFILLVILLVCCCLKRKNTLVYVSGVDNTPIDRPTEQEPFVDTDTPHQTDQPDNKITFESPEGQYTKPA